MRWIVGRRYVVLATLLCVFALARVAFAAGSGTCRLTYNYSSFGGGPPLAESFSCTNNGCTGTCPAAPTVSTFTLPDQDGDELPETKNVSYCHCVDGDDRPVGSANQYCQGLGTEISLSGGGGSFELFCVQYGSCPSCIKLHEVEGFWPMEFEVWCSCP